MKTKKRLIFLALVTTVLVVAGTLWRLGAPATLSHGRLLQNPIVLDEFALVEADRSFGLKDLQGRWSVLSFGYSHCPDVCPTALAYFRDELKRLPEDDAVQFIFVSVDPARDTPEKLRTYVMHFHPAIRGVTGAEDELKRVTRTLHTSFAKEGEGEAYTMAHAPQYFVVNPEGKVVAFYSPPLAPGALAEDLRVLSKGKGLFL